MNCVFYFFFFFVHCFFRRRAYGEIWFFLVIPMARPWIFAPFVSPPPLMLDCRDDKTFSSFLVGISHYRVRPAADSPNLVRRTGGVSTTFEFGSETPLRIRPFSNPLTAHLLRDLFPRQSVRRQDFVSKRSHGFCYHNRSGYVRCASSAT